MDPFEGIQAELKLLISPSFFVDPKVLRMPIYKCAICFGKGVWSRDNLMILMDNVEEHESVDSE